MIVRKLNPLQPEYRYPGGQENINYLNDPYGASGSSVSAMNLKRQPTKPPMAPVAETKSEKPPVPPLAAS